VARALANEPLLPIFYKSCLYKGENEGGFRKKLANSAGMLAFVFYNL